MILPQEQMKAIKELKNENSTSTDNISAGMLKFDIFVTTEALYLHIGRKGFAKHYTTLT